jgi:predicted nucleic acid-binding protein
VIVVDTGAIIALVDRDDRHHTSIAAIFSDSGDRWIVPWAVLPEVDYLLGSRLSEKVRSTFLEDVATGAIAVHWGSDADLARAAEIDEHYKALKMGMVDAVVLATAERLRAEAIVTLDMKHFGAVRPVRAMKLLPRDGGER